MPRPTPWSPADKAELVRLMAAGETYDLAATALNRSKPSIKKMCVVLGIKSTAVWSSEQRSAVAAKRWADPGYRERQRIGCINGWVGADERREIVREAVRTHDSMGWCQRSTKDLRSEITTKANNTRAARTLGWLPPAYRAERDYLIKSKKYPAREADMIIREQIARDEARAAATAAAAARAYSRSWAGQLERAARLGVTELPVYQTAEHSFSLTGSTLS